MILKIDKLTKQYSNGVVAMDNVTLTIEKGMFGLLGPNGAGKSSLMRTLATLQDADSGSVMLGDIDVLKKRMKSEKCWDISPRNSGYTPEPLRLNSLIISPC